MPLYISHVTHLLGTTNAWAVGMLLALSMGFLTLINQRFSVIGIAIGIIGLPFLLFAAVSLLPVSQSVIRTFYAGIAAIIAAIYTAWMTNNDSEDGQLVWPLLLMTILMSGLSISASLFWPQTAVVTYAFVMGIAAWVFWRIHQGQFERLGPWRSPVAGLALLAVIILLPMWKSSIFNSLRAPYGLTLWFTVPLIPLYHWAANTWPGSLKVGYRKALHAVALFMTFGMGIFMSFDPFSAFFFFGMMTLIWVWEANLSKSKFWIVMAALGVIKLIMGMLG